METCNNCFYIDSCSDEDKSRGRCEYYCSLIGYENMVLREYEVDLKMRTEEYQKVVKEQQS